MVTLRQRRQEEVRSRPEPVRRQALFPLRPGSFFDSALLGRYKGCTPEWVEWKASGSDSTHPAAADPSPAEPAEPAAPPAAAASARHDEAGAAGAGPLFGEGSEGDEDLFGEDDAAEGSGKGRFSEGAEDLFGEDVPSGQQGEASAPIKRKRWCGHTAEGSLPCMLRPGHPGRHRAAKRSAPREQTARRAWSDPVQLTAEQCQQIYKGAAEAKLRAGQRWNDLARELGRELSATPQDDLIEHFHGWCVTVVVERKPRLRSIVGPCGGYLELEESQPSLRALGSALRQCCSTWAPPT